VFRDDSAIAPGDSISWVSTGGG